MYKMVYSDMDGTLLNSKKEISTENYEVIKKLKEKDIIFGIATGRIYPAAKIYSKELDINSPLICSNGAMVVDVNNDEIIISNPLDAPTINEIVDIIKKYDVYFHLYDKDTIYAEKYDLVIKYFREFSEKLPDDLKVKTSVVKDINTIITSKTIYKIGVYFDDSETSINMIKELKRLNNIESCKSMSYMYDIMAKNINKGYALKQLGEYFGIEKDSIMTFGDNENDISMLKYAGKGIAMDNSSDEIKLNADFITKTNDNHGVRYAIDKFILNK
ncbi:Cof-type HAD-IIB family hydrolase [Helicovermis profundi]|uniref:Cof-type HAD-IIB family hydrolase n=1 Tax=Helicovermis profundi TaxID=3065157 RepID=A0AAU9E463_9FIRM|nr:Cof-type HAD-IIB family hydrolase [Clostridia bacterium S502]